MLCFNMKDDFDCQSAAFRVNLKEHASLLPIFLQTILYFFDNCTQLDRNSLFFAPPCVKKAPTFPPRVSKRPFQGLSGSSDPRMWISFLIPAQLRDSHNPGDVSHPYTHILGIKA